METIELPEVEIDAASIRAALEMDPGAFRLWQEASRLDHESGEDSQPAD